MPRGILPLLPTKGGEGRGEEGRFYLDSPLPTRSSRGEGERFFSSARRTPMNLLIPISFAGAAVCIALAAAALVLKRRSFGWLFFGLGTMLLAADSALGGLTMGASSAEQIVLWQKLKLTSMAFLPGTWLVFSLCYSRGNYRE